MNRIEIQECNDIETLRRLCLAQRKQLAVVSEILVTESKWDISPERAIEQIRNYLVKHQYDLKLSNQLTADESVDESEGEE